MKKLGILATLAAIATLLAFSIVGSAGAQAEPSIEVDPPWVEAAGTQAFTVTGSGFSAMWAGFLLGCTAPDGTTTSISIATCDLANLIPLAADANGNWSAMITINVVEKQAVVASDAGQVERAALLIPIGDPNPPTTTTQMATTTTEGPPATDPCTEGLTPTHEGTEDDDTLVGTFGDDIIFGLGGNDRIFGLGGDDIICAGDGNDRVFGGRGNNTIWGGPGIDKIRASDGDDIMRGGDDRDFMKGGGGDDMLFGEGGPDHMGGSAGNDVLEGGSGADYVRGGADDDMLSGGGGDDILAGSRGIDTCDGGNGVDLLLPSCETQNQ